MSLTKSLSAGCLLLLPDRHAQSAAGIAEKQVALSAAALAQSVVDAAAHEQLLTTRATELQPVLCAAIDVMPVCQPAATSQPPSHAEQAPDDAPQCTDAPRAAAGEPLAQPAPAASVSGERLGSGSVFPIVEDKLWLDQLASRVARRSSDSFGRRLSEDYLTPASPRLSPAPSFASVASDVSDASELLEGEEAGSGRQTASRAALNESQAAYELFLRLNHARQTVDYVKRQLSQFSQLNKGQMGVWDALELLNELREYEAAMVGDETLTPDMALKEHALQTAEACRLAHPDDEWLHLVGLLHGLGKLLAHKRLGGLPQWTICGESFPVGCAFSRHIECPQFFSVNPDRRRRIYNSSIGMYKRGCGLKSVYMTWSASEYLHLVLVLNRCTLPPQALFVLRYQKFFSLLRGSYKELLNDDDRAHMPWLECFQELSSYKRSELPGRLEGQELTDYYDALIRKYIPEGLLFW